MVFTSTLFEFLQLWYEDSIPPPDGVTSSIPVQGRGMFPSFFPNSFDPPSPQFCNGSCPSTCINLLLSKLQPQPSLSTWKPKPWHAKGGKNLRQKRKGKDAVGEVIDLDADLDTTSQPLHLYLLLSFNMKNNSWKENGSMTQSSMKGSV